MEEKFNNNNNKKSNYTEKKISILIRIVVEQKSNCVGTNAIMPICERKKLSHLGKLHYRM